MTYWPLLILTVINLGAFYWGVLKFFQDRGSVSTRELRILQVSTMLTWISCVYGLSQFPAAGIVAMMGIVLEIISGILFVTAVKAATKIKLSLVFSKDTPTKLLNFGPYRWVRHPFYTSYLLCYAGAALGSQFWPSYAFTVLMIVIYIRAAKFEEAKFEGSPLADEYRVYRSNTWAFFPKIG